MKMLFDKLEPRVLLAFTSDDFNATALNASRWTFVNPRGDATLSVNGTNAVISVPAGLAHSPWTVNLAPRLMQAAANTDFELEAKFESYPGARYTGQGILVEASVGNYIRFDFYHDGASIRTFASTFVSGAYSIKHNQSLISGPGPILYMKVQRQGNRWIQRYSYDRATWHNAADFTHSLAVTQVGVFASNDVGVDPAPAFAASVDYVFNTASPINPEDANESLDTTPPIIDGIKATGGSAQVPVTWLTSERATGIVDYGLTSAYELGSVAQTTPGTNHSVFLNLDPYKNYHFRVRATNTNGHTSLSRDMLLRSGGPVQSAPVIDVFNGTTQSFGQLGHPQRWANVMGRVYDADGVSSLTYSLNGGAAVNTRFTPNGTRLEHPGDFNIELATASLLNGSNTLLLTARDSLNNVTTRTVTINYTGSPVWPLPYTTNWDTATSVSQVAQPVDGVWNLEGDGVRTVEMGYDRLLSMGDISWTDYEITVPVTVNAVNLAGNHGPPGVGIGLRWEGHYGLPGGNQPNVVWWPLGAIGWFSNDRVKLVGNNSAVMKEAAVPAMQLGTRYIMKMRVESTPGQPATYSFKVWQDGTAEPSAWSVSSGGLSGESPTGSIILIAHHSDTTFGRATIANLGGDSPPVISNVVSQPSMNQAQISWTTNEPTTGVVQYGLTTSYELGSVPTTRATSHSASLPGLQSGTTYHFRIRATDDGNNLTTSQNYTFTTGQVDTTGPVVQNVQSQPGSTTIGITWNTNEPARGVVQYGLTTAYELGSVSQSVLGTSHSVTLNNLQVGQTYHFRIVATDSSENSTTTGNFAATTNTGAFNSDDFSGATLDTSRWSFVNPRGDGSFSVNGSNLLITVPAGQGHDAWTTNLAPRVMQPASNQDFELEAKFETVPTQRYSEQGVIVEASPGNYIRFDFFSDGGTLRVYSATFANGGYAQRVNKAISTPASPVLYMRVRRQGNAWTQSYSYDGNAWTVAASFSHTLAVSQVGVFAGNEVGSGPAPAFTASVDYVFNTAAPIVPEDNAPPVIRTTIPVNNPALFFSPDNWVVSGSDYKQTVNTGAYFKTRFTGTSANLLVDVSMLMMGATDFPTIRYRVDGGAWIRRQLNNSDTSISLASALAAGTHDLEVWLVATQDGGARWTNPTNVLRVTGLSLDDGASVVAPLLRPNRALVFGDSITEGRFNLGTAGTSSSDGSQTWAVNLAAADRLNAELGIIGWNAQGWGRAGNGGVPRFHEPGNTANQTWRYLYNGELRDFSDAPDYVLINLGTNDTRTGVAGSTVQAAVTDFIAQLRLALPNTPIFLIVPFAGYDRSFITAGFDAYRAANSDDASVYLIDIGASGNSLVTGSGNMTDALHPNVSGHAVAADLTWAAMNPEPDMAAPVVQNVQSQPAATQVTITWTTDEPTTAIVEYGLTEQYELGFVSQPVRGTSHSVTLSNLQIGATYHFRIVATDDSNNVTTTGDFTATTSSGAFRSDDFSGAVLDDSLWTFVNPRSDGSVSVNGTQVLITVPSGLGHDAWTTNLAPRIMQPASNEDFEIEAKFQSRPTQRYTEQGIIVEASPGNYIRFDFFSDGSSLRTYAATFANGGYAQRSNRLISAPATPLLYMRVRRQGNVWTQSYSYDGNTWLTATTFSHTLTVTKVGVFAGNEVGSGPAPAFTAIVDYFFNTESPITPEDGAQAVVATASISTTTTASKVKPKDSFGDLEALLVKLK